MSVEIKDNKFEFYKFVFENVGYLYHVLKYKYVEDEEVLSYIFKFYKTKRNVYLLYINYRQFCILKRDQHMKEFDKPFYDVMEEDQTFKYIYDSSINPFANISEYKINSGCLQEIKIICDIYDSKEFDNSNIKLSLACRSNSIIPMYFNPNVYWFKEIVNTLNFDLIRHVKFESIEKNLIRLSEEVYDKFPDLWEKVIKKVLFNYIKSYFCVENKNLKDLKIYNKLFPELVPDDIVKQDPVVYKFSKLSQENKSYILGFPIHKFIPDNDQIEKAFQKLRKDGIDKYVEHIRKYNEVYLEQNKSFMDIFINFPEDNDKKEELMLCNEKNTLSDSVMDYNLFDIVTYYISNKHYYIYNGPEFEWIHKNKKCPWNNTTIPQDIFNEINYRETLRLLYKLIPSKTLKELLTDLFNENDKEEDVEERSEFPEEHIDLIMARTGVDREIALEALRAFDGDAQQALRACHSISLNNMLTNDINAGNLIDNMLRNLVV